MKDFESQLSRMRSMMNYGMQTENKNTFSNVEYSKVGADGKTYGIVREGTKYYIKVAEKKNSLLKEDYNYIGGFSNRKDYEYTSFANAQKQFDIKMSNLKENANNPSLMIESWNPEKKEMLQVEATDKMKAEIARQKQIMKHAALISENKAYLVNEECCGKGCKVDGECAATQKDNIKAQKAQVGDATDVNGDPYTENPDKEFTATQKNNQKQECKARVNEEETLAWNDNKDYLDMSNGTEVGDSAPFTEDPNTEAEMKNGVVEEGEVMHTSQDQNTPAVGTSEVGDDAPYDEPITEAYEIYDEDGEVASSTPDEVELDLDAMYPVDEAEDMEDEFDFEDGEEEPMEDESFEDLATDEEEPMEGEEDFAESLEDKVARIENLLNVIAEKLGVSDFDDNTLYDDSEGEDTLEDDAAYEVESDELGEEEPMEDDFSSEEEDDFEVVESVNYKKLMKEDKMNYFGKHPAYRKSPMQLPKTDSQVNDGYYDMNDDSVYSEQPFGQEVGDSAPFEVHPDAIENAIAEAIIRTMKDKKKL